MARPLPPAAPCKFVTCGVRELSEVQRHAAQHVLLERFAQGNAKKSSHNRKVVNMLLWGGVKRERDLSGHAADVFRRNSLYACTAHTHTTVPPTPCTQRHPATKVKVSPARPPGRPCTDP